MSKEDREYEAVAASVKAMQGMIQLLRESGDPRFDEALLDQIIEAGHKYLSVLGQARDLLKEYKRQKWPTDDWKIQWASRREVVELEKEQSDARMRRLMEQLAEARSKSGPIEVSPEHEARYMELLDQAGLDHEKDIRGN